MDGFAKNFAKKGHLADKITGFKFSVDQLSGLGSARGQIMPFSIDRMSLLTQG